MQPRTSQHTKRCSLPKQRRALRLGGRLRRCNRRVGRTLCGSCHTTFRIRNIYLSSLVTITWSFQILPFRRSQDPLSTLPPENSVSSCQTSNFTNSQKNFNMTLRYAALLRIDCSCTRKGLPVLYRVEVMHNSG